jgi:hypothetical protein
MILQFLLLCSCVLIVVSLAAALVVCIAYQLFSSIFGSD